ncbi:putative CDF-family cation efflux system protein [Caenibius tardaugens NBRC 16725]|uniref:Putative CDF-family cation efflux system protein n=1 Tax=Caenibius tardaugens NBRC 16725 TaxID=1219035 RepID=U2ZWF0_9SPHN|nr:cation transporter [Caenibius tardaugens]AZI37738.1 cation transporter [Caenibius tardaugens NBRC 16725]GAD49704.1 putative CDF-family cation efflux system protein [Caenibius tardaugens NBRC 16725]
MTSNAVRRAIAVVALLNLAYFFVEGTVALRIGSASLLADSADFFEDAAVNFLILMALGWTTLARRRVGHMLALILLLPAIAFLATLWTKVTNPLPPDAFSLSITGLGALVINLGCALLLVRVRHVHGSLTRAAFLSARNDAVANIGIIAAGLITLILPSVWPDIVVGLAIAWMNLDAAKEVWEAARNEGEGLDPEP